MTKQAKVRKLQGICGSMYLPYYFYSGNSISPRQLEKEYFKMIFKLSIAMASFA